MSKSEDPRLQEAFRLLAEMANEEKQQAKEIGFGYNGWTIDYSLHPDYRFHIEITNKTN